LFLPHRVLGGGVLSIQLGLRQPERFPGAQLLGVDTGGQAAATSLVFTCIQLFL
jgi:hypothetical protein